MLCSPGTWNLRSIPSVDESTRNPQKNAALIIPGGETAQARMFPTPLIALGATLGSATGLFTLCGLFCLCSYAHKKKRSMDSGEGTPVTMTSVLQPGQVMNIYKCTEPVQPQAKLRFPLVLSPKQTSPEIINGGDSALKVTESDQTEADPEKGPLETVSGGLSSDPGVTAPPSGSPDVGMVSSLHHTPKLRYSLGYERQTGELCVSFLEAVGALLPGEEDAGSQCYVLGTLSTQRGQTEAQTAPIRSTAHAVWEEALLFTLQEEERALATLTLALRHCDRYSRHQGAGEITLSLANVGIPFGTARWVDLRPPGKDIHSASEVLLSMSYLPAANRLIVVLIKARNIYSNESNNLVGKDLYVKVTLWHRAQRLKRKQSKRVKHKINPVWNEMMMFEVPPELLQEVRVEVEMLGQEPGRGANHTMGSCRLGSDQTVSGQNHWQEMRNNPRRQTAMWHHLLP